MKMGKSYRMTPHWKRPVRFWTLAVLINRFGLPKLKPQRAFIAGHRKNPYALWDEVRSHWRRVRRSLHPDTGGCAQRFAVTSAIYDEIQKRLKRQGIET